MAQILVEVPPEDDLGPKMRALNERQRAFVTAHLETGKGDNTLCASMAGYSGSRQTLAVTGHRLAHNLQVLEAMHEEAGRRLASSKVMAVSQLISIAQNSMDDKNKLTAIKMILNRTGMHELSEHKVTTVDASRTDAEMIKRITQLATGLGLDAKKLLGHHVPAAAPAPIDGEFTEVVDDDLGDIL